MLFLGHLSHSEMVSYISLSDVVIVPSFTESFSYPAFISYNLGKKVIISKFSQLAQYDLPSVFPFSPQSLPSFLDALQTSLIAPKPAKVQPIHYPVESQAEQLYRLASNTIPLLIYHNGDQLYLKCVLKRLVDFGYRVILICCSRTSIEVSGVQVLNLYGYVNEDWNRFNQSYSHMSFNGYNNELICFKRWFDIKLAVRLLALSRFWHLDSDIWVLPSFYIFKHQIEEIDLSAISTQQQNSPYQLSSSAHVSFWNAECLSEFCHYLTSSYSPQINPILLDKWRYHQANNQPGGVCDMTLLHMWISNRPHSSINLFDYRSDVWDFNDNINYIHNNKPALLSLHSCSGNLFSDNCRSLPFLHCQGRARD